jgi:hypothetical protein
MITDEQIDSLSDDNDIAFVQYETIIRKSAQKTINQSNWQGERVYVTHILAFLDTKPISGNIPNDPPLDDGNFSDWYRNGLLPAVKETNSSSSPISSCRLVSLKDWLSLVIRTNRLSPDLL